MKNVNDSKPEEQKQPTVNIVDHYIKSVSFDSTRNANNFTGNIQPKTDIAIDVFTEEKGQNQHEVGLHIKSTTSYEGTKIFSIDLRYAGLCILEGISDKDDQKEKILNIYCPSLIFPFARRVVADLTRDAGYLPMLINGLDFASAYDAKNAAKLKVN